MPDQVTNMVMGVYSQQIRLMRLIYGGSKMQNLVVLKAEQLFVEKCKDESFKDKPLDFINGFVNAKLGYALPDSRMFELAKEVRQ